MADSDDEPIALSSHALSALQEFYGERDAHAEKFEKLKTAAEDEHVDAQPLSMDLFTEDWNKSQFWYSDETAILYARQLLDGVTENDVIAVVSTPSVFIALKNLLNTADATHPKPKQVYLLEHDQRFAVFPEFIFYDFQQPVKLPAHLKGAVDRIICDPPFLSEDCQTKIALTLRWMSRSSLGTSAQGHSHPRILISTGERMEPLIMKLYRSLGARTTTYEPIHAHGLSNEFYCYANFECDAWKFIGEKEKADKGQETI
ncbi:putative N6-adenine methyltransferase-domain-containing protein [Annulohypoxylon maeteangense]|uniref:putative N6-adenine methyltransferase-domain-containing protein n=1 Tax=Annulohypoxylon maeteangense TaxID=1927788 RepID=UPI0020083461|nr:putative N6-adenine methyltransferase-domain-containing protein [Annulohypoxylon maeteangense]KAI0880426.1 putative N6-adenine methyltransferase-domain-containing protein [Annulohypoxylon maeteangense]